MCIRDRYNTYLEEAGNGLSGGEKQRLALARAFLKDANLYIPVSYTHLDVYKRQPQTPAVDASSSARCSGSPFMTAPSRQNVLVPEYVSGWPDMLPGACLLYTSRCV